MSALVSNDFESIKKRLGKLKIFCLLFSCIACIIAVSYGASIFGIFAILGLCSAILCLSARVYQLWRAKHEDVDILKYESHLYALVAIGLLITYIAFLCQGYYFYMLRAPAMLLGFITFTLFAIEARLTLCMQRQNANVDVVSDISKQPQFA